MTDSAKPSLRERKKTATKRQIIQISHRMFSRYGFDAITLEQIADECLISVRTILRYFNTKEALALAPEHGLLDLLQERLAKRDTDAVGCWREFVAEQIVEAWSSRPEENLRRMQQIYSQPSLHAEFLRVGHGLEDTLACAIDEDSGGKDPLGSRLFATLLVQANSATFRHWLANDQSVDAPVLLKVLDYAVEAFHPPNLTRSPSRRRRPGRSAAR